MTSAKAIYLDPPAGFERIVIGKAAVAAPGPCEITSAYVPVRSTIMTTPWFPAGAA